MVDDLERTAQPGDPPDAPATDSPDDSPATDSPDALGTAVSQGLRWSAINQVASRVLTFVSGVIVLRLLAPEQVGTFGAAFAIATLLLAVNEIGLIPTIVQWGDNAEHTARTAYTLALASSCFWYVVTFLAAPWLAEVLGIPGLTGPLRIVALTVPIDGLTSMPNAFILREFRQRGLAGAEFVGMVVQIGVSVGLALAGAGAAALAWGQTLSNLAAAIVLVVFVAPRILPGWDAKVVKPLLAFSLPISGAAIVRDGGTNADSLVVGGTLGATQLGFYQLAFNVGSLPFNLIGATIGRVTLPGFARLAGDGNRERMNHAVRRSTIYLAAATVPLVALIAGLAAPLVEFVYGPKWIPAIDALRFLVILGGLRTFAIMFLDVCIAEGRPKVELYAYGLWIVVLLPLIYLGARTHGITGAAVVHVVVMTVVVFPIVMRALHRIGLKPLQALRGIVRPTVAAAAGGLAAYAVTIAFTHLLVQLVAGATVGAAVCAAIILPGNHEVSWNALRRWRGQVVE